MHVRHFAAALLVTASASVLPAFAQGSDACVNAQAIAGTGAFPFDNSAATTDGSPDAACDFFGQPNMDHDVWFSWTAPSSGPFEVSTCGQTGIDSKIAVLDGSCAGAVLACNDDACSSLQTSLTFAASAGSVYIVRVGTFTGSSGGSGTFSILPDVPLDTRVNPANGHTYHLLRGGSWTTAEATAMSLGGHLATVDDQAEHDWILAQWHNWQGVDVDLWIGLNDAALEGAFVWADGTPVGYTNWDVNEPNDGAGGEDYAAMRKNNPAAYWNDLANAPTGFHANPLAVVEVVGSTGSPICFGDGSGTACPCGNNSAVGAEEGCLNSFAQGGKLVASGSSSVSADTLALQGSQMPNSSALYFQGTSTISGGAGVVFGDGLRCAGGSVTRLGTKANSGGASQYPAAGDPAVSVRGNCAPGDVRTYQVWYRNAAVFCTAATFNLTNGLTITWNP
jgi:hypothetical protein